MRAWVATKRNDLGRKYGQNAIVWVGSDGVPELGLLRLSGQVS